MEDSTFCSHGDLTFKHKLGFFPFTSCDFCPSCWLRINYLWMVFKVCADVQDPQRMNRTTSVDSLTLILAPEV